MQLTSSVGLKDMTLHIDSYSSADASYENGTFVIGSNAMSWAYTIGFTDDGGCSINIEYLEISTLDHVTMYSDNPKMNGIDVSQEFQQVKQTLNDYFKSPTFSALIKKFDFCKANPAYLSKLFAMMF